MHLEPPPWLYAWLAKGPLFRRIYRRFVADLAASLPAGAKVLDVGTGPGYLPAYLARQRPDLDLGGLDFSYAMIRRAHKRHPGLKKWLVADAQALPFPAGVFDQTFASFSLHTWPKPLLGVQEMARVLKPAGRAWILELRREATANDLRQFARSEGLPLWPVYLGFKVLSWHHSLRKDEFAAILQAAATSSLVHLHPAHYLLWRAELLRQ